MTLAAEGEGGAKGKTDASSSDPPRAPSADATSTAPTADTTATAPTAGDEASSSDSADAAAAVPPKKGTVKNGTKPTSPKKPGTPMKPATPKKPKPQ